MVIVEDGSANGSLQLLKCNSDRSPFFLSEAIATNLIREMSVTF